MKFLNKINGKIFLRFLRNGNRVFRSKIGVLSALSNANGARVRSENQNENRTLIAMPALPPKRAKFVLEYLKDLNATQAAIRAGYPAHAAKNTASELLTFPDVKAAVDEAIAERSAATKIDAEFVLRRLHGNVEADLADLYDEHGVLRPVKDWPKIWRQGLVQGIDVEEIYETIDGQKVHVGQVRKVKLDSRVKHLELMGKHVNVKAFMEQVNHSGSIDIASRLDAAAKRAEDAD